MRDRSGFGWLALIVSILLVLLGIATFIWPEAALESFVMVYGVLAVATGIMDIVFYARVERHTGFGPMTALVSGILSVMCGFMLLVYPSAGQWAMTLLFPLWFLTHCISNLTHLNWVRPRTAASRSVSTAWSCCSPMRRPFATCCCSPT